MKADIVIGLGFGDEGKGKTVSYLCQGHKGIPILSVPETKTIVVRFSGGQQAGHNVKNGDLSHVNSNFGSGTLFGVPSYFSEHCTIFPTTIYREKTVLESKGITPELIIHPLANVTTPYDVAFNRLTELKNNHGSCGLGVAATMKRNLFSGYKLYAIDLFNRKLLYQKLDHIFDYYLNMLDDEDRPRYISLVDFEEESFYNAINNLTFNVKNYDYIKDNYDYVIFEGSQGILLDMNHGIFPNVTYANTTSKNALEICKILGILPLDINIYYVTRCYQTRHGNGWMSNQETIELINTHDEINIYNQWQKEFKIGEIDYELLNYALDVDNIYSNGCYKNLVVTCIDQRPEFQFDYKKLTHEFKMTYLSGSATPIMFQTDYYF